MVEVGGGNDETKKASRQRRDALKKIILLVGVKGGLIHHPILILKFIVI